MIPRYATPTKSSKLYTYTNNDQDLVKLAFRGGNFTFLKKFPAKIKPFALTASLNELSKRNLLKTPRSVSVKTPKNYPWMPDSFENKFKVTSQMRAESIRKRNMINKRDFVCSGTPTHGRSNQRGFISINSSYSSASEHSERLKWIKDSKVKHGNFRIGKPEIGPKSPLSAQEIITRIRVRLTEDWKSSSFDIGMNDLKCIEIRFFLKSVENCETMNFYMNTLVNKNQEFLKYCLKKVPHQWGLRNGKFLVFVLAPAWVTLPKISGIVSKGLKNSVARRLALISTRNSSMSIRNCK
jgi:hypothetical protein